MIIGSVKVQNNAVVTHRDSYLLKNLSVVSVRKPFLAGAIFLGSGMAAFGYQFADLLYQNEVVAIIAICLVGIGAGTRIGQLSLLSRDLKGSELSGAVWGRHASLQNIRTQIVDALHQENNPKISGDLS